MRKFFVLLFGACLFGSFSFSQQITSTLKTLAWSDSVKKIEFSDFRLHDAYSFEGAAYDQSHFDFLPYFYESVRLPSDGNFSVTLIEANYSPLNSGLRNSLSFQEREIENTPKIFTDKGYE